MRFPIQHLPRFRNMRPSLSRIVLGQRPIIPTDLLDLVVTEREMLRIADDHFFAFNSTGIYPNFDRSNLNREEELDAEERISTISYRSHAAHAMLDLHQFDATKVYGWPVSPDKTSTAASIARA